MICAQRSCQCQPFFISIRAQHHHSCPRRFQYLQRQQSNRAWSSDNGRIELVPTADFQEREAYDFFGIVFRGHPDLRRILMPEDYVGWPQRRDFPVGGEPVLFTHNEIEMPRWYE
jgi:hypothetical protein